jgi:hypothetical protein
MDKDVKVMFTDHSTRDFIITASNIEEAEKVFDIIFNHMELSITDLLKQYSVGKKTKVWVEYHIDKEQDINEEEND